MSLTEREVVERMAARAVGQMPLSIATSLALEGAFGIHPDRPPESPAPILKYSHIWINVRTLVRNILGALEKDFYERFEPHYIHVAIHQEMRQIETNIISATDGNCQLVFYLPDYFQLKRVIPGATERVASTEKQAFQEMLERICTGTTMDETQGVDVRSVKIPFEAPTHRALILTHMPLDLLSRYGFAQLDLLESHTGAIKPPAQWYTKLTGGRDLPPLPFNKFTLKLFGDGNNLIAAQHFKVKRAVLEVAVLDNWSALTTMDKIRQSIRKIDDPQIRATAQALLSD